MSSLMDEMLLALAKSLGSLVIGGFFLASRWSVASASRLRCSSSLGLVGPWHEACLAGAEALLGDAQRQVHPRAQVLQRDLVGQLHERDNP